MSDKLLDQQYRRTAQCTKYVKLIKDKSPLIPLFEDDPIDGKLLTEEYVRINGLTKPLLIKDGKKALHMRVVDSATKLSAIAKILGPDTPIKVIDVGAQEELEQWTFGNYASFFEGRGKDHKILNLISLEISASALANKIQGPSFVRQMDWIDAFWPSSRRARGDFPRVQKYLLAGMQGSFTDFHLDFGGTSVWYHIVWGEKIFYFIRPTGQNLLIFEKWSKDALQSQQFLPDLLSAGECFKVHMRQGDTMLIPGGWIHAVYTPVDSLVFGGNFIHSASIVKQLQIYGIEDRTRVGKKYRFPHFKQLMWLAVTSLLPLARSARDEAAKEEAMNSPFYEFFLGLDQPYIMKQWIYLIKICDLWVARDDLAAEDEAAYEAASKEAGCGSNSDVIAEWYQILHSRLNSADKAELKFTLDQVSNLCVPAKEFLLSLCLDSKLDSDCVMPRTAYTASDSTVNIYSSTEYTTNGASEAIALSSPDQAVKTERGEENKTPDPVVNEGKAAGSGLRLKFKLGSGGGSGCGDHSMPPDANNSVPTAAVVSNEGIGVERHSAEASISLNIEIEEAINEAALFGSDGEEEEKSQTTSSELAQTNKSFKFHLKEPTKEEIGPDNIASEVKTNLAFRLKKKAKATERIVEDTLGKERYGLRGLKLSAKFLENAADFVNDEEFEDGGDVYAVDEVPAAIENSDICTTASAPDATATARPAPATKAKYEKKAFSGVKRHRHSGGDFVFNDEGEEEEYNASDGGGDEDDEWVADEDAADDGDELYEEEGEEPSKKKKRMVEEKMPKLTPTPMTATPADGEKISMGRNAASAPSVTGPGASRQVPAKISNVKKIAMPTSSVTKSGGTIRQQLMKKLGQKYK